MRSRIWEWMVAGMVSLVLVSCQFNQPIGVGDLSKVSGEVPTVVLRYNPATGDMKPEDATLGNLINFSAMQGEGIDVWFNSVFSGIDVASPTEFSLEITNVAPEGLNFQKIDGRYVPADYHTFLFTTIYHHFDFARTKYQRLFELENIQCTKCFRHMDVHIDPMDKTGRFSLVDNAAYITGLDVFVIFPQFNFLLVNVGMNEPIIMHEVFHSIFEPLVDSFYIGTQFITDVQSVAPALMQSYFQHGLPAPVGAYDTLALGNGVRVNVNFTLGGFTAGSYTVINILNEGLADYFAFAFTSNGDILFHSFGDIVANGQNLRDQRRLDKDHTFPPSNFTLDFASSGSVQCSTSTGLNACTSLRVKYQYVVGTILARSLVKLGEQVGGHERISRVIISYLADFNNQFPKAEDITLPAVLGKLIAGPANTAGLKTEFCSVILENFNAMAAQINTFAACN